MNVFVTGGNGFIGSVVVRTLIAAKHEVSCLLRTTSNVDRIADSPFRRIDGDVRDAASVARGMETADAVIHLASLSNWNDIDSPLMDEVVEGGTRNILAAAAARKDGARPRVVFVSSAIAVNGSNQPRLFDETAAWTTPDAKLSYARSKRSAEAMCLAA